MIQHEFRHKWGKIGPSHVSSKDDDLSFLSVFLEIRLGREHSGSFKKTHRQLLFLRNHLNLFLMMLFNAGIKAILQYCVSVWASCNAGLLADIFKVQKRCARLILDAPFQARTIQLFYKLSLDGYLLTTSVLKDV